MSALEKRIRRPLATDDFAIVPAYGAGVLSNHCYIVLKRRDNQQKVKFKLLGGTGEPYYFIYKNEEVVVDWFI